MRPSKDGWAAFISSRLPRPSAAKIVVLTIIVYCGLGTEKGLTYDWSETYDLLD